MAVVASNRALSSLPLHEALQELDARYRRELMKASKAAKRGDTAAYAQHSEHAAKHLARKETTQAAIDRKALPDYGKAVVRKGPRMERKAQTFKRWGDK